MLSEKSAMKNEKGYFPDLPPASVHCFGEVPSFQSLDKEEALDPHLLCTLQKSLKLSTFYSSMAEWLGTGVELQGAESNE